MLEWKREIVCVCVCVSAITITPMVAVGAHGTVTESAIPILPHVIQLPAVPQTIKSEPTSTASPSGTDIDCQVTLASESFQSLSFEAFTLLSQAQSQVPVVSQDGTVQVIQQQPLSNSQGHIVQILHPGLQSDGNMQTLILQQQQAPVDESTTCQIKQQVDILEEDGGEPINGAQEASTTTSTTAAAMLSVVGRSQQVCLQVEVPVTILPDGRIRIHPSKETGKQLKADGPETPTTAAAVTPPAMDTLAQAVMELQSDGEDAQEQKANAIRGLTSELPIMLQIGSRDGSFTTIQPSNYRFVPTDGADCHCAPTSSSQGDGDSTSHSTGAGPVGPLTNPSQESMETLNSSQEKNGSLAVKNVEECGVSPDKENPEAS